MRRREVRGAIGADVDEGRRARAAVEVLVAAADGVVGVRGCEVDGERAGGVGEVPDGHGTDCVGARRERRHVVKAAGAVVDLGQRQDRDGGIERGLDGLGCDGLDGEAALLRDAGGDVEVGGEVAGVGEDLGPARQRRCHQHLVEVDRRRVRDRDGARCGADQRRDAVADALGEVHPAGGVPGADQLPAPALLELAGHARLRGVGHRAEGVAVEVDDAVGQVEEASRAVGQRHAAIPPRSW